MGFHGVISGHVEWYKVIWGGMESYGFIYSHKESNWVKIGSNYRIGPRFWNFSRFWSGSVTGFEICLGPGPVPEFEFFLGSGPVPGSESFLGSGPSWSGISKNVSVLVRTGPRFPKFFRSQSGPEPTGFGRWIPDQMVKSPGHCCHFYVQWSNGGLKMSQNNMTSCLLSFNLFYNGTKHENRRLRMIYELKIQNFPTIITVSRCYGHVHPNRWLMNSSDLK